MLTQHSLNVLVYCYFHATKMEFIPSGNYKLVEYED